jgi:hypothetical protein
MCFFFLNVVLSCNASFHTLCQCTKASFASLASSDAIPESDKETEGESKDQPLKSLFFTIRELTSVIALKVSFFI